MKKLFGLVLVMLMIFSLSIPVSAAETEEMLVEDFSQNYNVSPISPWEQLTPYGVNPPTEAWNVMTQGTYHFHGQAAYSTLYLSKLLYGADFYQVNIHNISTSNTLTVNPMDGVPAKPVKIAPGVTTKPNLIFQQRLGANYFGLSFNAPSYFEGYVGYWPYQ